jgi:hypothetical protein
VSSTLSLPSSALWTNSNLLVALYLVFTRAEPAADPGRTESGTDEVYHYRLSKAQEDEIRESFLVDKLMPYTQVRLAWGKPWVMMFSISQFSHSKLATLICRQ